MDNQPQATGRAATAGTADGKPLCEGIGYDHQGTLAVYGAITIAVVVIVVVIVVVVVIVAVVIVVVIMQDIIILA